MSVAIAGDPGRDLLEFGELVSPTHSLKGELEFPIEESLSADAAFEQVLDPAGGSKCAVCHGDESVDPNNPVAFASAAFAFRFDEDVSVESLELERELCNRRGEPLRCDRLDALLGWGEVVQTEFPEELGTIYDQ